MGEILVRLKELEEERLNLLYELYIRIKYEMD